MAIPYRTAKYKSANIFVMSIWGLTAKFNFRHYFRLYTIAVVPSTKTVVVSVSCLGSWHNSCQSNLTVTVVSQAPKLKQLAQAFSLNTADSAMPRRH